MKIVFIGGVHGVGKTTLCQKVDEQLGLDYFTASEIIRKFKTLSITNKKVNLKDIEDNQKMLIGGLEQFLSSERMTLLDGHFVLLDDNNIIIKIPIDTFVDINPCVIIVLYEEPTIITDRLSKRDSKSYKSGLIDKMQKAEINYAKEVASYLDIEFYKLKADDEVEFNRIIQKLKG